MRNDVRIQLPSFGKMKLLAQHGPRVTARFTSHPRALGPALPIGHSPVPCGLDWPQFCSGLTVAISFVPLTRSAVLSCCQVLC